MLNICIAESSMELSKSGNITGEICFQIDDFFFPESNWNDFVVVILTWWNKSINTLIASSVGTVVEFNFMDGPFYIQGAKKNEEEVTLHFIKRSVVGENIFYSIDTDISELKRSINQASKKVIKTMRGKAIQTDDTIELKKVNNPQYIKK